MHSVDETHDVSRPVNVRAPRLAGFGLLGGVGVGRRHQLGNCVGFLHGHLENAVRATLDKSGRGVCGMGDVHMKYSLKGLATGNGIDWPPCTTHEDCGCPSETD